MVKCHMRNIFLSIATFSVRCGQLL